MFTSYHDITSRISEPPTWWDESAVPRYCAFAPEHCSDISAVEAALIAIECQDCGHPYLKAYTQGEWARGSRDGRWLRDDIRDNSFDGGDPPNYCCTGASMSAVPRRVVEYWALNEPEFIDGKWHRWKRDPTYEVMLRGWWNVGEP